MLTGYCVGCGTTRNLTRDHIIPLSKGGPDAAANIQTLCYRCNQAKADRLDWHPAARIALADVHPTLRRALARDALRGSSAAERPALDRETRVRVFPPQSTRLPSVRRGIALIGVLVAVAAVPSIAGAHRARHHIRHVLNPLIAEGGAIESRERVARKMHVTPAVEQPFPSCRSIAPRRALCKVWLRAEEREWETDPGVTDHLECRWRVRVKYRRRYPFERTSRPIRRKCRWWTTTAESVTGLPPLPEPAPIEAPPVVIPPSLSP